MDPTALRRSNVCPIELVDGRCFTFGQLRELGSRIDQIFANFCSQILIDLYHLELNFGYLAL